MKKLSHCEGPEFALRTSLRLLVIFGWLPLAISDIVAEKPAGSRLYPMAILAFAIIVIISVYEFGNLPEVMLLSLVGVIYLILGIFFLTSNYYHL